MTITDILLLAACLVLGYVMGNFQTSILISRKKFHEDIRSVGSGNAGSTNMIRVFGFAYGAFTFAGDFVKGLLAVVLGRLIAGDLGGYLCGLGAVVGHCYPVFFGFRGGKGVAATFGMAWVVSPLCAAITTVVSAIVMLVSKTVSLGSLLGVTLYLLLLMFLPPFDFTRVIIFALLWVLILFRHKENIIKLAHGEENKLVKKKDAAKTGDVK